jgi:hypothetical protein
MVRRLTFAALLSLAGCGASLSSAQPAPAGDALAPGVVHRFELRPEGPWAIHVVEVDPRACGVSLGSVKGLDRLEGVETTRAMAARSDAVVAVNADFFRARPFGVVEGPQVAGGEVVAAEGSHGPSVSARFATPQGVFGVTRGGVPFVGLGAVEGRAWSRAGGLALARVNAPPGADSLALYTRFAGDWTPVDSGAVELVLRVVRPSRAAGDTAVAVAVRVDTRAAGVAIGDGVVVLAGRGGAGAALRRTAAGDTVRWTLPVRGAPGPVAELVGGFPLLLVQGRPVLDRVPSIRPAFALERHPRTAVGLRADGTVLLVVVDGRQPGHSAGMTLPELTGLLLELGAVDALNLDGGGSTTLVVRGRIVNRPSDPVERPVTNALVVRSTGGGCDG